MRKIKRAVHFDFHTMPAIDDFMSEFDASQFAERLSECHVDYINMFGRCNIGFSYYPTKIGTPHPYLKGDLLGDIIRECHKRNIGVTAYLNGGLNHQLLIEHPEFMVIHKDGRVYKEDRLNDNYFRMPCYNTGYREHLLAEIEELLEKDPDGIFCDCLKPVSCYCPSCIKKMMSRNIDITDDMQVRKFAYDTLKEVFYDIRSAVPEDKRLFYNGHPIDDIQSYISHAEMECLSTDPIWGYDFLPAAAPYYRMFGKELVYMNGRFVRSWGDIGGFKSKAAMENDIYDALLYGYSPSVGDHLHPRYGIDEKLYDNVKEIYEYVSSLEPWTDGARQVTEAAILRNKVDYTNYDNHVTDSDKGAARMLSELKVSFDIVNEDMELDGYKLLVLPDNINITDKLYEKLDKFEGAILSTGKSIKKGKVWNYISEFEVDTNTHCFYKFSDNVRSGYNPAIKMKSEFSISEYSEPYFNHTYDGLHSYFYVPGKKESNFSAIAHSGNRVHICFNIFQAYLQNGAMYLKDTVESILDMILQDRIISTDNLPSSSRLTLLKGDKGDVLHVKVTYPEYRGHRGVIEEHTVLGSGYTALIDGEYKKAVMLPCMSEVEICIKDKKTQIVLPEIKGHKAFLLTR